MRARSSRPRRIRLPRSLQFTVSAILAIVPFAGVAHAVDRVWTGGSGNWMDTFHWDPAGLPAGGDRIFVTAADSLHKVITFNDTRQIAPIYNWLLVNQSGPGSIRLEQPGNRLFALELTVGLGGPGTYRLSGGTGGFLAATVNPTGVLQITGGRFQSGTFTQNGTVQVSGFGSFKADDYIQTLGQLFLGQGAAYEGVNFTSGASGVRSVDVMMNLTGTYNHNAGVFDATPASGTHITGGVSCATFNFNHASGSFGGSLEVTERLNRNSPSVLFGGDLINRGPLSIIPGHFLGSRQNITQIGGNVTQAGTVSVPQIGIIGVSPGYLRITGGAHWQQTGGVNTGAFMIIGTGQGGGGTYTLDNGTLSYGNGGAVILGHASNGTFIQNGGTMLAAAVIVGGAPTASFAAERGVFIKNGGLLDTGTFGTIVVGRDFSQGGTFTHNGGPTLCRELIINENATNHAVFTLAAGSLNVSGRTISHGTFAQTGGGATFEGNYDGSGTISLSGSGVIRALRIRQGAVRIGGDGRIVQSGSSFGIPTHRVLELSFEDGPAGAVRGQWDIGVTSLVIDYTGASPLADIRRYIASGYAGGSWNGTGLTSEAAAVNDRALGYAEAADVFGPGGGSFGGVFADNTSVLIKYSRAGDANLDGVIGLADFNRLAANFGSTNAVWFMGDFNYDGIVTLADFNRLASNFGLSAGPEGPTPDDWAALASAVPEPAGALPAAAVGLLTSRAGRRPRRSAHRSSYTEV